MAISEPAGDSRLPPLNGSAGPEYSQTFSTITAKYRPVPDRLYHYTDSAGLLGILADRAIRASSMRFLNDSAELSRSQRLADDVLGTLAEDWDADWEEVLKDAIRRVLRDASGATVYVISLSRHRDQLSQWRAYSQGGVGYAIGFDVPSLRELARRRNYVVGPCLYNLDDQLDLMFALCQEIHDRAGQWIHDNPVDPSAASDHFSRMFYTYFMPFAAFAKDPSFEEEGEWRVVSEPVWGVDAETRFRAGRTTLVPYRLFDLSEDQLGKISELVVGPSAHRDLALAAASQLTRSQSLPIETVTQTGAPYREV